MLDDEWSQFIAETQSIGEGTIHKNLTPTSTSESSKSFSNEIVPIASSLNISTTTKIGYLNQSLDLETLFFDLDIMEYSCRNIGLLKKVMKFTCTTAEELHILKLKTQNSNIEIISSNINGGRHKFKEVHKISVGKSSKELTAKTKKKSAFYNCLVVILRVKFEGEFREYHIKIFNTGKLEIPGIRSNDEFFVVTKTLLEVLKIRDLSILDSVDTVLINSNFTSGFYINRDIFYSILKTEYKIQCVYDPCSYPGIQCKFYYDASKLIQTGVQDYDDIKGKGYGYCKGNKSQSQSQSQNQNQSQCQLKSKLNRKKSGKYTEISIMVFRTGSILIVGMCDEIILNKVYESFKSILIKEFHRIVSKNQKQLLPSDLSKRKRKTITIKVSKDTTVDSISV